MKRTSLTRLPAAFSRLTTRTQPPGPVPQAPPSWRATAANSEKPKTKLFRDLLRLREHYSEAHRPNSNLGVLRTQIRKLKLTLEAVSK